MLFKYDFNFKFVMISIPLADTMASPYCQWITFIVVDMMTSPTLHWVHYPSAGYGDITNQPLG